ncbi:unnamed protein product [Closterium sp. Yama58-4]|nr:unnamed protein product [Closterium sp. Yama58-4]
MGVSSPRRKSPCTGPFSTSNGADVVQSNPEVTASGIRLGEDEEGDNSEGAAASDNSEGAAASDNSEGAAASDNSEGAAASDNSEGAAEEVEEPSIPVVAMADSRPIVVIVGRPNVGKSALFNKRSLQAHAAQRGPGVRHPAGPHDERRARGGLGESGGGGRIMGFTPSLLGNLPEADRAAMEASILQRTAEITSYLLGQAAAVLFLVDARAGIQPADVEVADWLRRSVPKHRVVVLANKCEGLGGDSTGLLASHVAEAYSLGFGDPIPISAESGEGLEDLYAAVKGPVEEREREEREEREREARERREEMEGRKKAVSGEHSTGMRSRTERGDAAALAYSVECFGALGGDAVKAARAMAMPTADALEEDLVEEGDEAAEEGLTLSSSVGQAEEAAGAAGAAGAAEIPLQLAIAGLPNVGKSTLVNSLLGAQRVLTGPEPGLTRDAVRIGITYQGKPMWLVDTAGWVKAAQARQRGPVSLARMDMERSIGRAHVVVLVLDAAVVAEEEKSLKTAERSLARWVWEEGRALVIAANKMDVVGGDRDKRWVRKKVRRAVPVEIAALLPQVHNVPIVFTSALHGEGGKELMQAVSDVYDRWNTMLPAARLKHWLPQVLRKLPGSCTAASVKSIVQVKSRPPTFVVRVTAAAAGDRSLARFFSTRIAADFGDRGSAAAAGDRPRARFFSSKIAADFGFDGVPVHVVLRTKDGTRW